MKIGDEGKFQKWLESTIRPLTKKNEFRESLQAISPDELTIDGQLNESCWHLEQRDFIVQPQTRTSMAPSFQFLQDEYNLYLGAEIKPPFNMDQRSTLSFRFNLVSLLGDHERGVRIKCEPWDEDGGYTGKAYVDCGKYRHIDTFQYASSIKAERWSFEFAIPLREVMGKGDRFLFYKITFRHQITDQIEQSFYPDIGIVYDKQGNQLFSADFKDYLVLPGGGER
jgi:hypothetical protein